MADVVHLGGERVFSLKEAQELLPVVRRITEGAIREVERFQVQIVMAEQDSEVAERARESIEGAYATWIHKIERLGAHPKGPWLVDFDNGVDLYCWRWPETDLSWAHDYESGFSGRYPIDEM